MAQEDTIAPMPAYAYAILAAESQCAMAYCALARHLSGGRCGTLARMEDGRNDAPEQASDYRRPPDPTAHLRKEGQVNKLLGERRDHEIRTCDVVMRAPALTAVGAHGDEHYHQHRDSGGEGVRQHGVPQRAPSQARDERQASASRNPRTIRGTICLLRPIPKATPPASKTTKPSADMPIALPTLAGPSPAAASFHAK